MIKHRIIPVLLLKGEGLVKTTKFKDEVYVGDPINAIKIFNEKEVDELCFIDIQASKLGREPNFDLLERIAAECFMPISYGGGLKSIEQVRRVINLGFEKVIINNVNLTSSGLLHECSKVFGAQSIVAGIDLRRKALSGYKVYNHVTGKTHKVDPILYAKRLEASGAGEVFINFMDRDGTRSGYDIDYIKEVYSQLNIPLIACGGARDENNIVEMLVETRIGAAAAGSLFVFHGKHKAVLITYPDRNKLETVLG